MAKQFTFNPFTGNFDAISTVTIGTANGLSITSAQVLSLALASTSTTGALSSTDWNTFNGKQAAGNYLTALTGDGSASGPGSAALTLATVNSNVGSFGSASSVATFTVNAKGLTTAAGSTSIQIAESQVTNLVSDLAGKQATGNYITALTSDVTASGPGSVAATIAANAVSNAKFRQSAALSLVGNSTNATANVADIAAATDGNVMRRAGTALGFGSLDLTLAGTVGSSILGVANGGHGVGTLAAHGVVIGNGTSAVNVTGAGTSGQVLTSNGPSADPTFQTLAAPTPTYFAPVVQAFTASGTYNRTYAFTVTSANATAGATYTNNGVTFTVVSTIASGTTLLARGNGTPLTSGTLTKASGTGDATITFSAAQAPLYCYLQATGAGGGGADGPAGSGVNGSAGGGGGGTALRTVSAATMGTAQTITVGAHGSHGNPGSAGTSTTIGSLATGGGGSGGGTSSGTNVFGAGGNGGVGSGGDINFTGGGGATGGTGVASITNGPGGMGGSSFMGGAAASSNAGGSAGQNYGGGGCGGSGGSSAGGNGADGIAIITEHYQ